jgi:hypothetical protein
MAQIIGGKMDGKYCSVIAYENEMLRIKLWEDESQAFISPTGLQFTHEEMKAIYQDPFMHNEVLKKYQLNFNLRLVARQ